MVLGRLDSHMQKNEPGPLSNTIHKNKFKMDERPKCETGNHQNPREEHRAATSMTSDRATFFTTHLQRQEKQKIK